MENNSKPNGKSIASFVLGIVGIFAWLLPCVGYPVTIVGLILGIVARKKEKNGFNLTGIILSAITLALTLGNSILGVILTLNSSNLTF